MPHDERCPEACHLRGHTGHSWARLACYFHRTTLNDTPIQAAQFRLPTGLCPAYSYSIQNALLKDEVWG